MANCENEQIFHLQQQLILGFKLKLQSTTKVELKQFSKKHYKDLIFTLIEAQLPQANKQQIDLSCQCAANALSHEVDRLLKGPS